MELPLQYQVLDKLSETQIEQLHLLYLGEWWTKDRSLSDVRVMLEHSSFIFGIVTHDSPQLFAFARVLTDRVFKALVLDVIIHPNYRSAGLGSFLMAHIKSHSIISRVQHIELYCLPEREDFYKRLGFTTDLRELLFMRYSNES